MMGFTNKKIKFPQDEHPALENLQWHKFVLYT